jgi:hypothetical protein
LKSTLRVGVGCKGAVLNSTTLHNREPTIISSQNNCAQRSLGGIIVDFQMAIVAEAH